MRVGKLEATGSFFLILALLNYLDRQHMLPMAAAACTLHELGHYLAIRLAGGDIKLIRLTGVGAEMVLGRPLSYWQEGLAALAGPGVNLLLALGFCSWEGGVSFAGLNLALTLFNLLPVGRLDGGRAVSCTLALLMGPDRACWVTAWLDRGCTTLLLAGGLLLAGAGRNVTLLLTALWVGVSCWKENPQNCRKRTCQRLKKPVQLKVRL